MNLQQIRSLHILSSYGDNTLLKSSFSDNERDKLSHEGEAENDGSYPIRNTSDLHNAIQAYGRSKDKAKTKAWIKRRAKELGAEDSLPDTWKSEDHETEGFQKLEDDKLTTDFDEDNKKNDKKQGENEKQVEKADNVDGIEMEGN